MDLDLELASPVIDRKAMRLCVACRRVFARDVAVCCLGHASVPFLDGRPLLLDEETTKGLLELIDECIGNLSLDPLTPLTDDLVFRQLPFLGQVLTESGEAEKRRGEGRHASYRRTHRSTEEILSCLRDGFLSPSAM